MDETGKVETSDEATETKCEGCCKCGTDPEFKKTMEFLKNFVDRLPEDKREEFFDRYHEMVGKLRDETMFIAYEKNINMEAARKEAKEKLQNEINEFWEEFSKYLKPEV